MKTNTHNPDRKKLCRVANLLGLTKLDVEAEAWLAEAENPGIPEDRIQQLVRNSLFHIARGRNCPGIFAVEDIELFAGEAVGANPLDILLARETEKSNIELLEANKFSFPALTAILDFAEESKNVENLAKKVGKRKSTVIKTINDEVAAFESMKNGAPAPSFGLFSTVAA